MMPHTGTTRKSLADCSIVVIAGAIVTSLVAFFDTDSTSHDDASVRANFIAIGRKWRTLGPTARKDNAFVKKGDLLFEIDPRDYQYALKQALSDRTTWNNGLSIREENCGRDSAR